MLNLKFTDFVCSHLLASWQEARKLVGAASNGNHDLALSNQYGKGSRHTIPRKIFSPNNSHQSGTRPRELNTSPLPPQQETIGKWYCVHHNRLC